MEGSDSARDAGISPLNETIIDVYRSRAEQSPRLTAFGYRGEDDAWVTVCWQDYWRQVESLARALQQIGLGRGDRVGIMAPTSIRWEQLQAAVLRLGGVVVGLDPQDHPGRLRHIAGQVGLDALAVHSSSMVGLIGREHMPSCKFILTLSDESDDIFAGPLVSWHTVIEAGAKEAIASDNAPRPEDTATIIFTSGTTGLPKGIAYTHGQISHASACIVDRIPQLAGARAVSWLPLAHLFQRIVNLSIASSGGTSYFVDDPTRLLESMAEVEPDFLIGVPRLYEKLHSGIRQSLEKQPFPLRMLSSAAIAVGRRHAECRREHERIPFAVRAAYPAADRLVLQRIRSVFGKKIRFMVSGSAPIDRTILEAFHAFGLLILEAYGLSENVVPNAINTAEEYRFGSVGRPLIADSVRIGPGSEVLVRGPGVSTCYFGESDPSADTTPEGYLRTGDQGYFDDDGFLFLQGRTKDIIKTSSGRRISPLAVEEVLRRIPCVDHAVVVGSGRKCLTALVTIDAGSLSMQPWKTGPHVSEKMDQEISKDARNRIQNFFLKALEILPQYERPAGLIVLRSGFSVTGGEITSNLKIRRQNIEEKYSKFIDNMYREIEISGNGRPRFWFESGDRVAEVPAELPAGRAVAVVGV